MPTRRRSTACIATKQVVAVAGGYAVSSHLDTVEVLNFNARQWTTVSPLPQKCSSLSAVIHENMLYSAGGIMEGLFSNSVFTCSLPDLLPPSPLESRVPPTPLHQSVTWQEVSTLSVTRCTLVLFHGDLLAVGGRDCSSTPTSNIYRYDPHTDSWTVVSQMMNKRSACLAVTLPDGSLFVVGGFTSKKFCSDSATDSSENFT